MKKNIVYLNLDDLQKLYGLSPKLLKKLKKKRRLKVFLPHLKNINKKNLRLKKQNCVLFLWERIAIHV